MKTEGKKDASNNHEDPNKRGIVGITIDVNISHEIFIDMGKTNDQKMVKTVEVYDVCY